MSDVMYKAKQYGYNKNLQEWAEKQQRALQEEEARASKSSFFGGLGRKLAGLFAGKAIPAAVKGILGLVPGLGIPAQILATLGGAGVGAAVGSIGDYLGRTLSGSDGKQFKSVISDFNKSTGGQYNIYDTTRQGNIESKLYSAQDTAQEAFRDKAKAENMNTLLTSLLPSVVSAGKTKDAMSIFDKGLDKAYDVGPLPEGQQAMIESMRANPLEHISAEDIANADWMRGWKSSLGDLPVSDFQGTPGKVPDFQVPKIPKLDVDKIYERLSEELKPLGKFIPKENIMDILLKEFKKKTSPKRYI